MAGLVVQGPLVDDAEKFGESNVCCSLLSPGSWPGTPCARCLAPVLAALPGVIHLPRRLEAVTRNWGKSRQHGVKCSTVPGARRAAVTFHPRPLTLSTTTHHAFPTEHIEQIVGVEPRLMKNMSDIPGSRHVPGAPSNRQLVEHEDSPITSSHSAAQNQDFLFDLRWILSIADRLESLDISGSLVPGNFSHLRLGEVSEVKCGVLLWVIVGINQEGGSDGGTTLTFYQRISVD
ncbi:unnamed protein product [Pleuronectes platessa]|uniref:Uncharacterized protein n=1 Tax=Pleuronectes platessa TaxID=8262 RepID=A0A9N7TVF9_PLEPL|nr:unnamed protein product [Pleuronectes platessa]